MAGEEPGGERRPMIGHDGATCRWSGGEDGYPLARMTAELLKNIEFRLAGPFRGGRVGAVAGDPSDPRVFYFGSTGGGV